MKVYQVVDDGTAVLVTADELTALRRLRQILEAADITQAWIDDMEVK